MSRNAWDKVAIATNKGNRKNENGMAKTDRQIENQDGETRSAKNGKAHRQASEKVTAMTPEEFLGLVDELAKRGPLKHVHAGSYTVDYQPVADPNVVHAIDQFIPNIKKMLGFVEPEEIAS